jgi:hypothetical protein
MFGKQKAREDAARGELVRLARIASGAFPATPAVREAARDKLSAMGARVDEEAVRATVLAERAAGRELPGDTTLDAEQRETVGLGLRTFNAVAIQAFTELGMSREEVAQLQAETADDMGIGFDLEQQLRQNDILFGGKQKGLSDEEIIEAQISCLMTRIDAV